MALLDDALEGGLGTGLIVAAVAGVALPVLRPVLRPITRSLFTAGVVAYDMGRQAVARASEATTDMVAEARAEIESSRREEARR
jgi:Protein of unknown function (DUF5132)